MAGSAAQHSAARRSAAHVCSTCASRSSTCRRAALQQSSFRSLPEKPCVLAAIPARGPPAASCSNGSAQGPCSQSHARTCLVVLDCPACSRQAGLLKGSCSATASAGKCSRACISSSGCPAGSSLGVRGRHAELPGRPSLPSQARSDASMWRPEVDTSIQGCTSGSDWRPQPRMICQVLVHSEEQQAGAKPTHLGQAGVHSHVPRMLGQVLAQDDLPGARVWQAHLLLHGEPAQASARASG